MKSFAEFNHDDDVQVPHESNSVKRHKVKEQLSRINSTDWEDFEEEFERFEKFKSRK